MSPATTAISEALPLHRQGVASALNDTVREVGAAVGIALMGSFLNAGYRVDLLHHLPVGVPSPLRDALLSGPGAFDAVAPGLGPARSSTEALVNDALAHGYARAMIAGLVAISIGTVLVARLAPGRRPTREAQAEQQPILS
jgi:hypothetical protein